MAETQECYSCGAPPDPKSPRGFCKGCDAHFKAGEKRQQQALERAAKIEEATKAGDTQTVSSLMREVFDDAAQMATDDARLSKLGIDATEAHKLKAGK